jgi:Ribbon-helix-helix protein, copG family
MAEPRRPGRPPLDDADPSVPVTVTLPSKDFDALCKRALREGVSIPEIIRRDLREIKSTK